MEDNRNCWKPIPEFSRYEINMNGDVRNISTGLPIKDRCNETGYHVVSLVRDNDNKTCVRKVHRLVLITFLGYDPNPERKNGNHLDGNKDHNYLSNLEWSTYSENQRHAVEHGLTNYDAIRIDYHVQVDALDFVTKGALDAANILHDNGYFTDVSTESLRTALRDCANKHRLYFGKVKIERLDDPFDTPLVWHGFGTMRRPIKAKLPSGLIIKAKGAANLARIAKRLGYWKDKQHHDLVKMISEAAHRTNGTCYGISVWFDEQAD